MNKNPFVPQPSYTPQQPPLPPGPPPPQPTQPDYTAYWAAAAHHQHVQPPAVAAYNTQWSAPQPPRPPPEQSALYANYGYGGQQAAHWQQQQRHNAQQPQQHFHQPPPPVAQPPPQPPPQPAYNPYQPTAGYPQQFLPQAPLPPPQPIPVPPAYPHPPPQPPPQQFFPQHLHQQPLQHQPPRHNHNIHHTPPHHLPPAKRQRFDGPTHGQHLQHRPPPMQFQPPPPPPGTYGPNTGQGHGRGGGQSSSHSSIGGGGGRGPGRGSMTSGGRGGRAGSMNGSRGGMGGRGGRGGYLSGGGGGGGGSRGGGNWLRGHGSRGNFGNNKEYHNRRGGSFNGGGGGAYSHQPMGSSFRPRGPGHNSGRGGRHDGAQTGFLSRDGSSTANFAAPGKKEENRRTLTDFKIIGLEIRDLDWTWGVLPLSTPVKLEVNAEIPGAPDLSTIKKETVEEELPPKPKPEADSESVKHERHLADNGELEGEADTKPTIEPAVVDTPTKPSSVLIPPPSRMRIYFHTPVTVDDSHPLPHTSLSQGVMPPDSRKGKRKKLEDDDGDLEEGRGPPPPPQMGGALSDDRSSVTASVAPSLADTAASEGDWLMAAIVEHEKSGELDDEANGEDGDQLPANQIVDNPEHSEHGETGDDVNADANGIHHADMDMGGIASRIHNMDGTANSENHVNGCDHVLSAKTDNPQSASAEAGENMVSVAPDTHGAANGYDGSPAGVAEVNGTDVPNRVPDAATAPKQREVASVPDGELITAPAPLELSQIDGHIDVSVSPAQNEPFAAPESASSLSVEEPSTNCLGNPDMQVPNAHPTSKPLEAALSFASTVLDFDPQDIQETASCSDDGLATVSGTQVDEEASARDKSPMGDVEQEQFPEPPASPTPNTIPSPPNHDESFRPPLKSAEKDEAVPSANRLSISYAGGNKRLVINAEVVETLKVFRHEGRIEVNVNVDKEGDDGLKGILIESLSDATKSYLPVPALSSSFETDPTLPPFSKFATPATLLVIVYLDTERPLSEPKWAKSGDIQEWLKSMFGRIFFAADSWDKKILVVDPDPPPTIWTVLEGWAVNSPVGIGSERQRFLKTHMIDTDNLLEILLRLVRGERATPFSQSGSALAAPSISGPLLSALCRDSAHASQQTHVSLAVLAMFRMSVEYAEKALGPKGKEEVEDRVGEIIRCLPSHLIYKSLDGIFKEWRVDKKGW